MSSTPKLKDVLSQDILYEVKENTNGELEYVLDENDEKIKICEIEDLEWYKIKLFKPIYEYDVTSGIYNFRRDSEGKKIKISKKSKVTPIEYIAEKRMGFTIDENNTASDAVEWITIDDLNKINGNFISDDIDTKNKLSQSDIYSKYSIKSDKRNPIQKDDILVSFKMTIGISRIFKSNKTAYCNEAIDVLTINDLNKFCNRFISLIVGKQYLSNVQTNVGSTTLNDDLKDELFLNIPKSTDTHTSYQLQQSIVKNIDEKYSDIYRSNERLNKMIFTLDFAKEKILYSIFKDKV